MEPQSHENKHQRLPQESQTWQPQDWREGRRLRAYELAQQGWKQCRIAEALGVTKGAVSQWLSRARDQGVQSLKTQKGTGAPPKVTNEQKANLPELLLKGAMAYGFTGDVWTAERVAAVIEQEWHVKYHSHYVAQLLRDCGWSRQKPVLRATQRDEEAITKWREQKMPALKKEVARSKKKPVEEQKTLLFIDESAFYPLPGVVRTWAPRGQTPLLHYPLTRDHLSVISAVTPEGELYLTMQEEAFQSEGIIAFLDELQKQISGRLLIVWDGATIHRSKLLKQYLETGASSRIHLERLPGYAPELNPDEGVWHYLKSVELGNVRSRDIFHLRQELTSAVDHLSRKPEIIQACFQQVGYIA